MKINRSKTSCIAAILAAAAILPACTSPTLAQSYNYTPSYAPAPPVAAYTQASTYTADQLDQMLGPIALYPDPLLSQVLAAATYPTDIAAAAQWLQYNPNPSDDAINQQPWDASVKALIHFPDVLNMMAANMDWTEGLGQAFANQQQDVMDSIQRLRAKAQAANTLTTTPQQQVVQDNGVIEILPAQPDVIYVPEYNPDIVYAPPPFAGTFITFGPPCPFGAFLDLGFDFHHHRFFHGRFDHDHHRFDFNRGQPWRHNPRRPIPAPIHPFFPPRGPAIGRGWGQPARTPGAFHPIAPRTPARTPRVPQRPITGLPRIPARPTPLPVRPAPAPTPVQPRAFPRAPVPPMIRPQAPAPRIGRPITGLPPRAMPAPRPAPPPRAAPAPRPAPMPHAPAFHPSGGGGAASERGNRSMHR
jgi:hypothetical protein